MKKLLISGILALVAFVAASAQDFKTGYFLDNYTYGYRINPASPLNGDEFTFFSLGLGNVSAELNSNFPPSILIAPGKDGNYLMPFLNWAQYSDSDILTPLADLNKMTLDANVNLLTFGRQTDDHLFSVELNVRAGASVGATRDFFSFARRGLSSLETGDYSGVYQFTNINLGVDTYGELAIGYSQKIGDILTIGGRVKALVGMANAAADWSALGKEGSVEDVYAESDANLALSLPVDLQVPTGSYDGNTYYDLNALAEQMASFNIKDIHKTIAGYGAAVDLGVTVEPVDGLSISASVLDLGFISWNSTVNSSMSFKGEFNGDDFSRILTIKEQGGPRFSRMLNYTAHAGVKYRMPFYDGLTVGALGTFQKNNKEGRLGVDFTPFKFLSLAASGGYGTFGPSFGAALNLRAPILNFFVGMDGIVTKFSGLVPDTKVATLVTTGLVITI
ncbi:MAG: hypothetical protein J5737_05220 [Bacteroidales bacterium]|nr:hypothetical protein [Bacteroidales bacterium]